MKTAAHFAFCFILALFSGCDHIFNIGGCSPGPEPEYSLHAPDIFDANEYDVYSVALKEKLVSSAKDPATIIVFQKTSKSIFLPVDTSTFYIKKQLPNFDETSVSDFLLKNSSEYYLDYKFSMDQKYVQFITEGEIDNLFPNGGGWPEYFSRYSYSNGYFTVSKIGFNTNKNQAVVALKFSTGAETANTASTTLLVLKKEMGLWKVTSRLFSSTH